MRIHVVLLVLVLTILILARPAAAQSATPIPPTVSPTAAATASATQSVTGTPVDPQSVYVYAPLPSGQQTAVAFTFTAGELLIAVLLFGILILLLFIVFWAVQHG